VEKLEEWAGFQFTFHGKRSISERANGLPLECADSTQFRFRCSQRRRNSAEYVSQHPYSRTRNSAAPREQYNCGGSINVYFPSSTQTFDIALEFVHNVHPGRRQFGVPPRVRRLIQDNPRPTPLQQREDLERAIKNGEVNGVNPNIFLSTAAIHYWWRKGFGRTAYISDDPYTNCEFLLQNHPRVLISQFVANYRCPKLSCSVNPELILCGLSTMHLRST
jgi:hypothetical protein